MGWLKKTLGKPDREKAEQLVADGVSAARAKQFDVALKAYRAAADADDTLAIAHLNAGLCLLDLFNRDARSLDQAARIRAVAEIAENLERGLALDASNVAGWRALAHAEERRFGYARAEQAWRELERRTAPGTPGHDEARRALAALSTKMVAQKARERALAALDARETADLQAALTGITPYLDDANVLPGGRLLASALAHKLGDGAAARAHLTRAVERDPADIDAHRGLSSLCIAQGDGPAALLHAVEAYKLRPIDAGLVCNVGVCHLALGDLVQAEEFIALAQRLAPKDAIVRNARDALKAAKRR